MLTIIKNDKIYNLIRLGNIQKFEKHFINDITSIAANGAMQVAASSSATDIYINMTPTINDWDEFTDGITDIYVTYLDNTMVG